MEKGELVLQIVVAVVAVVIMMVVAISGAKAFLY